MEDLQHALAAYRSFDPTGWVGFYRVIPMWAGIICAAVGVLALVFGGGRFFRLVAGPMGALVGGLWAAVVANRLGFIGGEAKVSAAAALVLGVAGFAYPPAAVFFAFGVPSGLLAGQLAGNNDWILGFVPAFLLCGAVATAFHRHIGAVASSAVGAWLLVVGVMSALHQVGGIVAAVASQPWGVIIAAALFATAGSVYQIAVRPSPEEAERLRAERTRAKKRLHEKRALEERWSNYSADKGER
ncbi:MAG: hypothetical protein HYZ28_16305 [Myxococcales bacterium]|nr:hypothetical protein [Myxococcales bacterium]